jgi:RNA polymerase sigma-70 factor (ECF subfamily)
MTTTALAPRTFDDFYAAFYPRVLGLASALYAGLDTEDLAQEAMARALVAYDRLDPGRDPWPWLVAITRNIACDRLRSERSAPAPDDTVAAQPMTPYEAAVAAEERRLVRRALARLSSADRRLLVLREWHELTFQEMASLVGAQPGTLRQQLFRARRRFAREFTALGGRALGLGTALAARCWRPRSRAGGGTDAVPYALPYVAQLAAALAAVAAVGVLAGPAPTATATGPGGTAARTTAAATVRGTAPGAASASTVYAGGAIAVKRHGVSTVPGRAAGGPASDPPPSVDVDSETDGLPHEPGSEYHDHVAVGVAGHQVYVDKWGTAADQLPVRCVPSADPCRLR